MYWTHCLDHHLSLTITMAFFWWGGGNRSRIERWDDMPRFADAFSMNIFFRYLHEEPYLYCVVNVIQVALWFFKHICCCRFVIYKLTKLSRRQGWKKTKKTFPFLFISRGYNSTIITFVRHTPSKYLLKGHIISAHPLQQLHSISFR